MKKPLSYLLAVALVVVLTVPGAAAAYTDIPAESTLAAEVQKAVNYGLMNGYSPYLFGYNDTMTRAQFVTVLGRMLGWFDAEAKTLMGHITPAMQVDSPGSGTPLSVSAAYYAAIDTAAELDVVDRDKAFRPNDAITRLEMAEMLVRSLGLKSAAAMAEKENSLLFTDVTTGKGYISIAYDIGMTKGTSATTFSPEATATRAQAAAMLVRIYEKIQQPTDYVHGFYALSSYGQLEYAGRMDGVSAGWSRMTWDGKTALLSTTGADGNEFYVPTGYSEVTDYLASKKVSLHLNVFMDAAGGAKELLASAEGRSQAVQQIVNEVTVTYKTIGRNPYSGVTIDFEGLRSAQKGDFTAFLKELATALDNVDKALYVCVSPVLTGGAYYDGYDYRAIGDLADKVILMAYDYEARDMSGYAGTSIRESGGTLRGWFTESSRNAPPGQVFWSLLAVTDGSTGVRDVSKVLLGVSSKNVAWEINGDDRLVTGKPVYLSNETAYQYIQNSRINSSSGDRYVIFTSDSGQRYFMWLEDPAGNLRSAKLLGVTSISLWRLGTLPMYDGWTWSSLLHTAR